MPIVRKQKGGESWDSSAPLSWPLSGSHLGEGQKGGLLRGDKSFKMLCFEHFMELDVLKTAALQELQTAVRKLTTLNILDSTAPSGQKLILNVNIAA